MTENYDIAAYGDSIAAFYDEDTAVLEIEPTLEVLSELGGEGPALELGVGTGRIALPLSKRGMQIDGIDCSSKMLEQLRQKPGSERIKITEGNFRDVSGGPYRLVFAVFNTFLFLLTQRDQRRCFENVARCLTDDGVFVIEAAIPNFHRFSAGAAQLPFGQYVETLAIEGSRVVLDAGTFDPHTQLLTATEISVSPEGVKMYPATMRYAWPSELDLMAEFAGLSLRERWGGWHREKLTFGTHSLVSIYEKAVGSRDP
ncbi:MAG: class I SAM-dependent methyltransferase [Acetobacteraceae bacterium]|nr:class I SAM-dependent methyltransferase [Acetobacteraceae bacterium]MBV8937283.1 class I SAM-dependent methyltransferase [Alphaproteobacteria bacterium]